MNFQELLGGVGKEFMNAAGDALAGAAKEYLGNAIQEIFVRKEADTKRTLSNIQHMKVVSSPVVLRAMLVQRIMFSVWRLCGDIGKKRVMENWNDSRFGRDCCQTNVKRSSLNCSRMAPRDTHSSEIARISITWSRLPGRPNGIGLAGKGSMGALD